MTITDGSGPEVDIDGSHCGPQKLSKSLMDDTDSLLNPSLKRQVCMHNVYWLLSREGQCIAVVDCIRFHLTTFIFFKDRLYTSVYSWLTKC